MKIHILFKTLATLLLFFICTPILCMQTEIKLCILCAAERGRIKEYAATMKRHYENIHKAHYRPIYVCSYCDFAGKAIETRDHMASQHHEKIKSAMELDHIYVPHVPVNPYLSPEQMQNYSARLYAILDEAI